MTLEARVKALIPNYTDSVDLEILRRLVDIQLALTALEDLLGLPPGQRLLLPPKPEGMPAVFDDIATRLGVAKKRMVMR